MMSPFTHHEHPPHHLPFFLPLPNRTQPLNRLMTSRSFTNLTQALKEREDWYNAGLDAIAEGQGKE